MNEFYCEHPDHPTALRRVPHDGDQYVATVDIMRADGKERMARVGPAIPGEGRRGHPGGLRLCRGCARLLREALKSGAAQLHLGERWVAPEQGTLV